MVVVDDDIDPTNTFDVLWAMPSRCDPADDIEIIRRAWSGPLDPRIPSRTVSTTRGPSSRPSAPITASPIFPPVAEASPELRGQVERKFADVLARLAPATSRPVKSPEPEEQE